MAAQNTVTMCLASFPIYDKTFVKITLFYTHHLYLMPRLTVTPLELVQGVWHEKTRTLNHQVAGTLNDILMPLTQCSSLRQTGRKSMEL